MQTYSIEKLVKLLDAKLIGDDSLVITGIAPLDKAQAGQISFLESSSYRQFLTTTKASAVLVKEAFVDTNIATNFLVVADPYVSYAKLTKLFYELPPSKIGIHPTAVIGENCKIDPTTSIGANCVIGDNVTIAQNSRIEPGCVIGNGTEIGADSRICANVTLYQRIKIGQRCLIHSGAVIGSDGFGNANNHGVWQKIYQFGRVKIGDDVEIGANTTIDCGALDDTVIEEGAKLDNQIQLGHNVRIGAHTAIAGCTGIAGSVTIGKHCMIGGKVSINGHIEIADGVIVTGNSSVMTSITKPGIYTSAAFDTVPHRNWWKMLARIGKLDDLEKRLSKLEKTHV